MILKNVRVVAVAVEFVLVSFVKTRGFRIGGGDGGRIWREGEGDNYDGSEFLPI